MAIIGLQPISPSPWTPFRGFARVAFVPAVSVPSGFHNLRLCIHKLRVPTIRAGHCASERCLRGRGSDKAPESGEVNLQPPRRC
jgi:hypothetical protein